MLTEAGSGESVKFSRKRKLEAVKEAIHIKRQKLECSAFFCEIYNEKWMIDHATFAKKDF